MRGRPVVVLPLIFFGSGCAATTRAGGQIRALNGGVVAGGDVTAGGGLGFASERSTGRAAGHRLFRSKLSPESDSAELTRLHAPVSLVRRALEAAAEEVGHARACFSIAERFLGREHLPGKLPAVAAQHGVSLESTAVECWLDGCLGEGAAARRAAARAQRERQPAIRRLLERIAREEARHAELGWDTLAFCVERGGDRVRDALRDAAWGLPAAPNVEYELVHREGHRRLQGLLRRRSPAAYGTSEFKYSSRFV